MQESNTLNQQQRQAVEYGNGPLLIIAGAGTGKTTVISKRISHLVLNQHIDPENILALTFTEKAVAEMQERVDKELPYGYTQMWIETFHSFCDRILKQEGLHIGLDTNYRLVTEAEATLFLKKHLFSFNLTYFRPLGNPNKFIHALLQHFNRLQDEDITPQQYLAFNENLTKENDPEYIKQINELSHAFAHYQELKIRESIMDFSDLIAYTLKLLRDRPSIRAAYQKQFHHILIDEFQDTNFAQNQLAILLSGNEKNITVVGDDDQAIYRWRGAAISNMIQFRHHFPESKIITLTKNYRSRGTILDSSYQLIQHNNPDRLEVREHIDKKLIATRDSADDPPQLLLTNSQEEEIDIVIETIQNLVKKRQYTYKDFAILVRANDHAQPFLNKLDRDNIPYQFLGPGQLFHQEEIKDLIAYLKFLSNIEDTTSLYRILTLPIFSISHKDILLLLNAAKKNNRSLFDTIEQSDSLALEKETKEAFDTFIPMLKKHINLISSTTAGQLLYYFLKDSGLITYYLSDQQHYDEIKAQNVAKFFDKLRTFETQNEDASVFAVSEWIELSMQMGESPLATITDWSDNDAINILTIHSSKGLEFPVVFIVNMVTQRFPSRERKETLPIPQELIKEVLTDGDFHMQEERRLCYVAMTRARDKLYLTASKFYGESRRERKLSPFINEALGETNSNLSLKTKKIEQLSLLESFYNVVPEIHIPIQSLPLKLTYISYSQIQTFDFCPLHYKLRYLVKIPTEPTPALSFGTSIHSALRDFYYQASTNKNLSIHNTDVILKNVWIPQGYHSKEHEHQAFEKALTVFRDFVAEDFSLESLPLALELPFQFFITNTTVSHPVKVGGRIDRINKGPNNSIEIIDYKTGKMPDQKHLENNLQLTIYALAATEIKNSILAKKSDEVKLSLYYLEEKKKITTTRTAEDLQKAKETLLQKVTEIETSNFLCSNSLFCKDCEYKMLCVTT